MAVIYYLNTHDKYSSLDWRTINIMYQLHDKRKKETSSLVRYELRLSNLLALHYLHHFSEVGDRLFERKTSTCWDKSYPSALTCRSIIGT